MSAPHDAGSRLVQPVDLLVRGEGVRVGLLLGGLELLAGALTARPRLDDHTQRITVLVGVRRVVDDDVLPVGAVRAPSLRDGDRLKADAVGRGAGALCATV